MLVLSIGVIYSLPNLYPAKPAIQIAYTDSGKSADQILLNQVTQILNDQNISTESVGLKENNIVAKFTSFDDQLAGKSALQRALLDQAIVALNLEPSTPQWLRDIGGGPLKLGLDLSGGVHFLLEVDIDSALDNRLESLLNEYRKKFRDDRISVESSRKDNKDLFFSFASDEDYNKAVKIFNELKADELVLLDIDATKDRRRISEDVVKRVGEEANMPFSVGGGIHSIDDIKTLISSEISGKPLSDDKLAVILNKEGMDVARRTVAKYRDMLNIPSSSQRRREARLQNFASG